MSYTDNLRVIEKTPTDYTPENVINLSTFDNPYEPGVKVREALRSYNSTQLSKSPDSQLKALKQALAKKENMNPNQVEVVNGLDHMLELVALACFNNSKSVMLPKVTCGVHSGVVEALKLKTKQIPLTNDFKLKVNDIKDNGGVLIKNPNAPTSIALDQIEIETILKNNPDVVVVVDEMYVGFGCESVVGLISTYPNLVVVKSMKAYRALSGIDVCYVIGSKEVVSVISNLKSLMHTSITSLSNTLALASLEDEEYVLKNARMVLKTKDYVIEEVKKMGFEVIPSDANFICIKHKKTPAQKISDKLLKRNYKVKVLTGDLEGYIALTISTQDVMNAFLKELKHAA